MKKIKRLLGLLLAITMIVVSTVSVTYAYSLKPWKITSLKMFVPYYEFGDTTISHFNEAMFQWNRYAGESGLTLMRREPVIRHYSTNYPETDDGLNRIYRVNTGSPDYLAQTTSVYYPSTEELVSADININMYYSWANCGDVPGCFDVWSVFLHEAGHVAGLGHSLYSTAVMYPSISSNVEKRYLTTDDREGLNEIYGNQTSLESIGDNLYQNLEGGLNTNDYLEVLSGSMPLYDVNEITDRSCLIVRAKNISKSDSFEIRPVFGDSTSIFTDYTFDVEETLKGSNDKKELKVRVQGGRVGERVLVVDETPDFDKNRDFLLFLYRPEMGSGYNTEGDYYYITGVSQGVYSIDQENVTQLHSQKEQNYTKLCNQINNRVKENKESFSYNDEFKKNLNMNLENGFIDEKDYQAMLDESARYATIVKR